MDSGEKELRQAFEEVTTKNVKTVVEYTTQTRELVRELEEKIRKLEGLVHSQNQTISALRVQLATVQAKVFSGGT
jgi:predicted RNase H-like nuclease (RuvC/YqgF family)